MRAYLKAKPGQKTAAQAAGYKSRGPIKLSPETIAAFHETADRAIEAKANEPPREPVIRAERVNRQIRIRPGMIFGHLIVRKKAQSLKGVKSTLKERWKVECTAPRIDGSVCHKTVIVPKYYLIRANPKSHCGCQLETVKSKHNREYRCWQMMHQRIFNENHPSYKHYKARGITIDESFLKTNPDGFDNWLADVGPCPSKLHSLDRIRNSVGYVPGNLRWSTAEEQRANQGDLIGGKTSDEIAALNMTEDEWVEYVKKNGYA